MESQPRRASIMKLSLLDYLTLIVIGIVFGMIILFGAFG